ncbi:hypothetical protein CULT_740027 [[Clostridium] ultunense Esp]|nr:hypothetical protein CULT_740027 [[Clostridium] ultunense Esp]
MSVSLTWIVGNAQTIFSIIVVFGLLIFVHELGHFLLAKRAGILVREFAIGFGPKLFSFKEMKRNGRSVFFHWEDT